MSPKSSLISTNEVNNGGQQEDVANKDIMVRNKTNMVAISKNEVDRMLFKKGLASPTLIKTEKNETMRRNWANRRVTTKTTNMSKPTSFMK